MLATIIIIYGLLIYKKAPPGFYFISLGVYFLLKGIFQELKENAVALRYKGLSKIFNNRIRVIDVNKDKSIFKIHSFLPYNEVEKKVPFIEHFLNKEVVSIKRDSKNFRLMTIKLNLQRARSQ